MDTARAGGRKADSKLSRVLGVSARHESGCLFVADLDEPDFVLAHAQGFHDPVDAVAGYTKDGVDAPIHQGFDEHIGCIHFVSPIGWDARAEAEDCAPAGALGTYLRKC